MDFPPLPSRSVPWGPQVRSTTHLLQEYYSTAHSLLERGNLDLHRVRFHTDRIINSAIPLLQELNNARGNERPPDEWFYTCGNLFASLLLRLREVEENLNDEEPTNVMSIQPVSFERTGKRGRPKKIIDVNLLQHLANPRRRITQTQLSRSLGIFRHTLRARLRENNIPSSFSEISDRNLDKLVHQFRMQYPNSGLRYLQGFLRKHGLRLQRSRVRNAMIRVDPVGATLRRHKKKPIQRRKYHVSRPNALWHIDGHHKLILWGFVIHGCVDGYSRLITGLRASTNNRASTVLRMFTGAITSYGLPSRVRGDHGGENTDVSMLMLMLRGLNRASFMWGSSTRNTRIERLWVEVGSQFARAWKAFFLRLERCHLLDRNNGHHLWLLHFLFLDEINQDCDDFVNNWNAHPLSGHGGHSPEDLFSLGQLEHGVYRDECEGWSTDEIDEFYGIHGNPRNRVDSESESDSETQRMDIDETSDRDEDVEMMDVDEHASATKTSRREGVQAPEGLNPFPQQDVFDNFVTRCDQVAMSGIVPPGYGLRESEWDDDGYPTVEVIRSGKRDFTMLLPDEIWRPRAIRWAQAHYLVSHVLYALDA